jgi:hypothetical protein
MAPQSGPLKSMGAAIQIAALWVLQPLAANRQQHVPSAIAVAIALLFDA